MSAAVIRFPRGELLCPGALTPDDIRRVGVEVFRGGIYLGTARRVAAGVEAVSAWHDHLGHFPDLDTATDAIFEAALHPSR